MVDASSRHPRGAMSSDLRQRLQRAFPHASDATVRSLEDAAAPRSFRRGSRLIVQGEPLEVILFIEGRAALRRVSAEGKQMILLIMGPGDLVGSLPAGPLDSPFELVSMSAGSAAAWKADFVRHLAAANAGLALDLLDSAALVGQALITRVDDCLFYDTRRRLARVLSTYRELAFGDHRPAITRTDLAALVGASREMTGRALRSMEEDRILTRVGRTGLRLLDAAGLQAVADRG
jgi:CRP-like cAMP-binding protein